MSWTALRAQMVEYFNDGELRDLCYDLNIDYESLAGATKVDRARELILYCRRLDRVDDLLARCHALRPHVSWPTDTPIAESSLDAAESDPSTRSAQAGGDVIMATIGAGASNVAVGKNIRQQADAGPSGNDASGIEERLSTVEQVLKSADLNESTVAIATFQLNLLRGELLKGRHEQPSASTIMQVGDWLLQQVPALREPMARLFTSPAATVALQRAGSQAVTWAARHFTPDR